MLGKHSGRHAFLDRINELGFALEKDEIDPAFQEFKKLADRKKEIFDTDIEAIVLNADIANMSSYWQYPHLERLLLCLYRIFPFFYQPIS